MAEIIQLSHGAGGTIMNDLVRAAIIKNITKHQALGGAGLDEFDDGASLPLGDVEVVVSSDAHTIDPIFFPGGDIGMLSACGAINDLAMMGAKPVAMTDTIVVEEGFRIADLERIVKSMDRVAREVDAAIIHGDFKVMPKGNLDGIIISTTGIGLTKRGGIILDSGLKPGDAILVSGPLGDHGIAIASVRSGIAFKTNVRSDASPLWRLMETAMAAGKVTAAKDPTRGGFAMAINEMASRSRVSVWLDEDEVPIREEVKGACEMLGLDPLELTCEGRAVFGVRNEDAERVLEAVRSLPEGRGARIAGHVRAERPGYVILQTSSGGKRIVNPPLGEATPRIC